MRALVALGSNRGPRRAILGGALADLGRLPDTRVVRASRIRETPPEAPSDGGPFLNAAALLETALSPSLLMRALLDLERRYGRPPVRARGPRTLDLDLVLYEGARYSSGQLVLPHPRFRARPFVLEPAAEVAPGMRDPVSGRTLLQLAQGGLVRRVEGK